MSRWYDKAMEELEADLENGAISQDEFRASARDLNAELQQEAADAAESAYQDVMGY